MYNQTIYTTTLGLQGHLGHIVALLLMMAVSLRRELARRRVEKALEQKTDEYIDLLEQFEEAEKRTREWVSSAESLRQETAKATADAIAALKKEAYDNSRELVKRNTRLHNEGLKARASVEILKRERDGLRTVLAERSRALRLSREARQAWSPLTPEFMKDTPTAAQIQEALRVAQGTLRSRAQELADSPWCTAAAAACGGDEELARQMQQEEDAAVPSASSLGRPASGIGLRRSARLAAAAMRG